MNRHFTDAAYYVRRAAEEAATGLRTELQPVEDRARSLTGREAERDPTTRERVRQRASSAEQEARQAVRRVRQRT
ncbi:DUF7553 family protein [Halobacterium jilantaiense]|uniref:Uncharacterized protein n=1 Tax=Halobacterium jilantaiense TaxID=355548 RepID=A0A1I0QND6_9EURY|nr:hypothetical protein [Halobacterium jilantaiense]SEW28756.1 hypothetical protein SAMN04487945_2769 [Halobacterium jilantaiense]